MKNAVGREIPEEILKQTEKDVFKGSFVKHLAEYKAATHTVALAHTGDHADVDFKIATTRLFQQI